METNNLGGKIMRKRVLFLLIAIVFVLAACGSTSENSSGSKSGGNYVGAFSTGSAGGLYNLLGGGLANLVNTKSDTIQFNATTPPSVSKVPQLLHSGQAAFGIGMADMFHRAKLGEGEFTEKTDKIQPVLALYDNIMAPVVLSDSGLNKIAELENQKVGVSSESTKSIVESLFEESGVNVDNINWVYLSFAEQEQALRDGNIDVGVFTSMPKSGLLEGLAASKGFKFLKIDDEVVKSWNKKYPLWSTGTIPANTYEDIDEDYEQYNQYTVLYAGSGVPEDVVYEVTKLILENHKDVSAIHPAGESVTPEKTTEYIEKGVLNPEDIHPGAIKYFKEKGYLE